MTSESEITCIMSNGKKLNIFQKQVPIVSNFTMIDFNLQEYTCENNVYNLQNCQSHQSMYTCLCRESTYNRTVIVQRFNLSKIQGSLLKYLKQNFCNLELLNRITRLRYIEKLDKKVEGIIKNQYIYLYRKWKGESFIPKYIPKYTC